MRLTDHDASFLYSETAPRLGSPVQRQVVEPNVYQKLQSGADFLQDPVRDLAATARQLELLEIVQSVFDRPRSNLR